jgi:hypothetical protein
MTAVSAIIPADAKCVKCGSTDSHLALSSQSGFKHYVCISDKACRRRRGKSYVGTLRTRVVELEATVRALETELASYRDALRTVMR